MMLGNVRNFNRKPDFINGCHGRSMMERFLYIQVNAFTYEIESMINVLRTKLIYFGH